jgi:hypothetical protein
MAAEVAPTRFTIVPIVTRKDSQIGAQNGEIKSENDNHEVTHTGD